MHQMDQGWNLDIGELAYNPSTRDLSDAKVHHMLSEDLWKPNKKVKIGKNISFSRSQMLYLWFVFRVSAV